MACSSPIFASKAGAGESRRFWRLACVVVPIIANGLRAFGTIYIAQHQGIEFAASFDHVFYGWMFFGIVIALVMAAGWPFFDKRADAPAFDPATLQRPVPNDDQGTIGGRRHFTSLLHSFWLVELCFCQSLAGTAAHTALPQVAGWQVVPYAPTAHWTPRFRGRQSLSVRAATATCGAGGRPVCGGLRPASRGRELIGLRAGCGRS